MSHHNLTIGENVARPLRTGVQAVPAYALVEFVDAFIHDMTERQYAAAVVLLTMVISLIQTTVENGLGKAFLRRVPPVEVPVVDDFPGHSPGH